VIGKGHIVYLGSVYAIERLDLYVIELGVDITYRPKTDHALGIAVVL
jgi:hypothetical protein